MNNTAQIVRKVMDNLYVDPTEGFLLDYKVKVNDEGRVTIHALIDHKSYWNDGTPTIKNPTGTGGYFNLMSFIEQVKDILKYVSITDVMTVPYLTDDDTAVKDYKNI